MYSFYRFALEHAETLHIRPHLTVQCAMNWLDGQLPTLQANNAESVTQGCLRLIHRPTKLGALLLTTFGDDDYDHYDGNNNYDPPSHIQITMNASITGKIQNLRLRYTPINSVWFSSDGDRVVSGGKDGKVKVWDAMSGEEEACMAHDAEVTSVCFSTDGRRVASGGKDGSVKVWNALSGEEQACLAHHERDEVMSVRFTVDGRRLLSAGVHCNGGSLKVWDALSNEVQSCMTIISPFDMAQGMAILKSVCFSTDGDRVVSGGIDGSVKVWEVVAGEHDYTTHTFIGRADSWLSWGFQCVCFSPDLKWVARGSKHGSVRVWDALSGDEKMCMLHDDDGGELTVSFSSDGRKVVSGGHDGNVKVWLVKSKQAQPHRCMAHGAVVNSVCFSSDDRRVASGGQDGIVKLWDVASGNQQACMLHGGQFFFNPELRECLSRERPIYTSGKENTCCVCFGSFAPKMLMYRCNDSQPHFTCKECISIHVQGQSAFRHGKFTPYCEDGCARCACIIRGMRRLVEEEEEEEEIQIVCPAQAIDETRCKYTIRQREPDMQIRPVFSVCFSADGKRVASAGTDGKVKVWDATSGKQQACVAHITSDDRRFFSPGDIDVVVKHVRFASNGYRLISEDQKGNVKVWDLNSGKERTSAHADMSTSTGSYSRAGNCIEVVNQGVVLRIGVRASEDPSFFPVERGGLIRQDANALQLRASTPTGDVEVGFIRLGPIKAASFNAAGNICVVLDGDGAPCVIDVGGGVY
jgi:WD40 repeat protein